MASWHKLTQHLLRVDSLIYDSTIWNLTLFTFLKLECTGMGSTPVGHVLYTASNETSHVCLYLKADVIQTQGQNIRNMSKTRSKNTSNTESKTRELDWETLWTRSLILTVFTIFLLYSINIKYIWYDMNNNWRDLRISADKHQPVAISCQWNASYWISRL